MASFDPTASAETWHPVPGFPGYEISNRFRVRSWWRKGAKKNKRADVPTLMSVYPLTVGYLAFHARFEGKPRTLYLHHVVAELAHGPRPDGMSVLHRDDVKANNDPSNLYYGTESRNAADRFRNGRSPAGSARAQAKIDEADAAEIRRRYAAGHRQRVIAADYGIGQGLVSRIVNGERWTHA